MENSRQKYKMSQQRPRRDSLEEEQTGKEEQQREDVEGDEARLTEVAAPAPIDRQRTKRSSLEGEEEEARRSEIGPADNAFLSEVADPPPVERDEEDPPPDSQPTSEDSPGPDAKDSAQTTVSLPSRTATEIFTVGYLIFFAILGTLARLGLQALTFYPGAPVTTGVLWANFGGSFFMGFLAEDQRLYRQEWGASSQNLSYKESAETAAEEAKKSHGKVKKTLPLYIGLATGFCGSFTSFSSFIRDVFLALSNNLPSPVSHSPTSVQTTTSTVPRNGGYSFMALVAVIILTVSLSVSALNSGAHFALALDRVLPTIPFPFARKYLEPCALFLGLSSWLGAIFLAIWPPDRHSTTHPEFWRSRAVFAVVFAPLGCLLRFYVSKYLNPRIPSFPLGTFVVNILGTIIEGMCYDLQHSSATTSYVGCQVLQGVMDGFCGCTTTVSTWVAELNGLRRRHAYLYGSVSVVTGLCFMIVIMGSLRWDVGFRTPVCTA